MESISSSGKEYSYLSMGTTILGQTQTRTDGSFSITGQIPSAATYAVNFEFYTVSVELWSQNITVKGVVAGTTVNF
jgi:hypothetical protein